MGIRRQHRETTYPSLDLQVSPAYSGTPRAPTAVWGAAARIRAGAAWLKGLARWLRLAPPALALRTLDPSLAVPTCLAHEWAPHRSLAVGYTAPWLIDWGLDNRSAMVRIPPERGSAARLELRLGDSSANAYLAIGALLAGAYVGIRDKIEPPAPLEGYGYNPEISPKLPSDLGQALDALEADAEITEVLGEAFVKTFLAYKRNEIERFSQWITDWEFREYTYHI